MNYVEYLCCNCDAIVFVLCWTLSCVPYISLHAFFHIRTMPLFTCLCSMLAYFLGSTACAFWAVLSSAQALYIIKVLIKARSCAVGYVESTHVEWILKPSGHKGIIVIEPSYHVGVLMYLFHCRQLVIGLASKSGKWTKEPAILSQIPNRIWLWSSCLATPTRDCLDNFLNTSWLHLT